MSQGFPRLTPFGERAFLVELGDGIDVALNARVHALAAELDVHRDAQPGLGQPVPAYASLLVPFDPALVQAADVALLLGDVAHAVLEASPGEASLGALLEIPVRYGGEDGPDLADVASRTGLTEAEVIDLHAGPAYHVFMLGFAPGFAYLGPLPEALRLPRRPEPRLRVAKGSVAIAAGQTAVYPHETAGGWHVIGRTDLVLWDPASAEPVRVHPGDRVRFVPA